jgi:hypothetical protein
MPVSSDPVTEEASEQVQEELASIREKYSSTYTMFSYSDLARITSNFSPGTYTMHFIIILNATRRLALI